MAKRNARELLKPSPLTIRVDLQEDVAAVDGANQVDGSELETVAPRQSETPPGQVLGELHQFVRSLDPDLPPVNRAFRRSLAIDPDAEDALTD